MQKGDKEILIRYINDKATVDEQARVEDMFCNKGDDTLHDFVKSDWYNDVNVKEIDDKNFSYILDRVHHKINLQEKRVKQSLTKRVYSWYSAVAAVVLFPLLALGVLSIIEWSEVNRLLVEETSEISFLSPMGVRTSFILPDDSKVVLSGGSSIKYSIPFSTKRDVELKGEAYFDVSRNKDYPFVVSAGKVDIKVLGTRFNVSTTLSGSTTEVILEEGSVECTVGQNKIELVPDEKFSLVGNSYTKSSIDASKFTAWRHGTLIFRGDSMNEVAKRISQWYNVDVEVKGSELLSYSFRATFQDDSLEEAMRLLKMSSPINYKIIPRKKLSDGSFSKKRLLIYNK